MRWVRRESRSGWLFRDLSAVCGAAETTRGNSQEPDFRMRHHERPAEPGWRFRLHEIVFEAETRGGKLFDVLLLTAIVSSVAAVMLESVPSNPSAPRRRPARGGVGFHAPVHRRVRRAPRERALPLALRPELLRRGGPAGHRPDVSESPAAGQSGAARRPRAANDPGVPGPETGPTTWPAARRSRRRCARADRRSWCSSRRSSRSPW